MVAMLDRQDPDHVCCVSKLRTLPNEPLVTTWCCCTETMYFLGKLGGVAAQNTLWALILSNRIQLHLLTLDAAQQMKILMDKYHDLPMDLADASLVVTAEELGIQKILTLDKDFFVYRLANGSAFDKLL